MPINNEKKKSKLVTICLPRNLITDNSKELAKNKGVIAYTVHKRKVLALSSHFNGVDDYAPYIIQFVVLPFLQKKVFGEDISLPV